MLLPPTYHKRLYSSRRPSHSPTLTFDLLCIFSVSPSEEGPIGEFSREGFGRQSMSEKRKGNQDARLTDFYQKVKENREKQHYQYYSGTFFNHKMYF